MENKQNYMMDNINVASAGDGVVGGVQAEIVSGVAGEILGIKYDEHHEEHDVVDDDELKYVEEVQQSEKQQQQQLQALKNFDLDDDGINYSNDFEGKETSKNAVYGFGNGNGDILFDGDHKIHEEQQQHDLFNLGNGHDTNGHDDNNINGDNVFIPTEFDEKLNLMENAISYATESAEGFVPQIDVKIETRVEHHEMADEEEPSSLATNTTNGTSSLSENVPPQAVVGPHANAFDDLMANLEEDKENSNPLIPNELDLEQAQSQLNPDAKEFIPSFGSNPASPTSPFPTGMSQNEQLLSDIMETQNYFVENPSAVPRHILVDDDFVAQSPRKGKCDNNMDTVSLPKELAEFEQEADKRPHELESEGIDEFQQRDEVMTPDQGIQQLPLDDLETKNNGIEALKDSIDFHPSKFIDHGPETCVDLDSDLDMQPSTVLNSVQDGDDVMKRSIYVASDDTIEDVLNSVQPIPAEIDGVKNVFTEESGSESAIELAGNKELLQVEEKEYVSHSPSTEEIEMNFQNTLNSSNKDIKQLPIDMNNVNNMQESIYMEHEFQAEEQYEQEHILQSEQQPIKSEELYSREELNYEKEHQVFQEDIQEYNQLEAENQLSEKELEHEKPLEVCYFQQEEQHLDESYEEQQVQEESSQKINDIFSDQQPTKDPTKDTILSEENLLPDKTNHFIGNDSLLDNATDIEEQQQEMNKSFSQFKISDEVSNTAALESLNFNAFADQQDPNISEAVLTPSFTANEKHLLEETKEQQMLSMSDLEQQMSGMTLNNTDGHLAQAEEVVAPAATTTIEEMSDNLITPDEAAAPENLHYRDQENTYELENVRDQEKTQELENIEDQEKTHELENIEDQEKTQELENIEDQEKTHELENIEDQEKTHEVENIRDQEKTHEVESIRDQENTQEQEKLQEQMFIDEETEIENVTKLEEENDVPLFMVPETTPAEQLKPPMGAQNETEIVKNEIEANEKGESEAIKEPEVKELKVNEETVNEEVVTTPEIKADIPVEAAIVAATASVAAVAAVTNKVASSPSKSKIEATKKTSKTTTSAAKSKDAPLAAAKKPVEAAKKPVGATSKPRTAAIKPSVTNADKKPIGKTTATTATTTATRKPLTAAASKVASKSTTSTPRMVTAATKTTTTSKPTTAPRAASATTTAARKPATANGPLAKPRPTTVPAKPTTLGLSGTNGAPKTKSTSPRTTVTSQVRKATTAITGTKSPIKSTTTNGVAKTASSTLASRTKTTTSTVASTAGTASKPFTARPAPKFPSSSSTTTTTTTATARRLTVAAAPTSSTTSTTAKTPLRKSTPTKPTTGRTPTKSTNTATGLKSKTPITKQASSPSDKPAPIRKPVNNIAALTNGEAIDNKITLTAEEKHQHIFTEAVQQEQQNGDSSIPMQTEKQQQQSFLETNNEQTPRDLINA